MFRRVTGRAALLFAAILSVNIVCCSVCYCAEQKNICIVLSRDIRQFRKALEGFDAYCKQNAMNISSNEFVLRAVDRETMLKRIEESRADYILPIGDEATELVSGKLRAPVIFCMATENAKYAAPPNTGVLINVSAEDKIQAIKKVMPDVSSVGILFSTATVKERNELAGACAKMGIKFIDKKVGSDEEFVDSLNYVLSKSNCFIMTSDYNIYYSQTIKILILKSIAANVPVVGITAIYTKLGALMSVENDYADMGRQVGAIFRGIINNNEDPGSVGIQKAKNITFSLNLTIAQRLGINIAPDVIKQADEKF